MGGEEAEDKGKSLDEDRSDAVDDHDEGTLALYRQRETMGDDG